MKKVFFILYFWVFAANLMAQNSDAQRNYVQKTTVRKAAVKNDTDLQALTNSEKSVTTEFADSWGRKLQTVQHHASPVGNDIVQPYYYDNLGRPAVQYLPYTIAGTEGYRYREYAIVDGHPATTVGISEQQGFYQGQNMPDKQYPYILTAYDNSPLNQATGQSKLGLTPFETDNGYIPTERVNITQYSFHRSNKTNQANHDKVRRWTYEPQTREFDGTNFWAAQTLLVQESKDESIETTSYKDARGRTILQRQPNTAVTSSTPLDYQIDTYSIYNDLDQLIAVIQPEGVRELATRTDLNQRWKFTWEDDFCKRFVFLYEYDEKGQMVAKTVPDKEKQRFFYDDLGRLVAAQEAITKNENGDNNETFIFSYKKYDIFGREIMAGTFEALPETIDALFQNSLTSSGYALYENKQYSTDDLLPYSNENAFPRATDNGEARITKVQVLQINYYDDYNPQQGNATVQEWFDSQTTPFINPAQPYTRIKGKQTFGLTKVLQEGYGTDLKKDFWEFTALFYDEYGHTIQTQHYKLQWGEGNETIWDRAKLKTANDQYDIATSEYEPYRGEVLKTQLKHRYPETTGKTLLTIQNRYLYDHAGRLTHTYQQHLLPTEVMPEILVTKNTYNEVEKNAKTQLHSQNLNPEAQPQDFVQEIDYAYTINGWLYNVNNLYEISDKKLFALSYRYSEGDTPNWNDFFFSDIDGTNTNGNITHTVWRSKRGAMPLKGFSYNYGLSSRTGFTHARYSNNILPTFWQNGNQITKSFTTAYDLNGNIKSMKRLKGQTWWLPNINDQIDNLTYNYEHNGNRGNKLRNVTENALLFKTYNAGENANDFRVRRVTDPDLPTDPGGALPPQPANRDQYQYDENGNLTKDANKGITLKYNYLHLPTQIMFWEDRSTIDFVYNAAGERLQQKTRNKEINYVNGFLYENGILKSFGLPNGQVVNVKQADNSYKLEYEYHYKDHQGNLRLAFRVKASKKEYSLTGEQDVYSKEISNFANNGTTNQGGYSNDIRVTAPVRTGAYAVRLERSEFGTEEVKQPRIFKRINVTAGTKLDMTSFAYYSSPFEIGGKSPLTPKGGTDLSTSKTPPSGVGGLLAAVSIGSTQIGEQKAPQVQFNLFGLVPIVKQLFKKTPPVGGWGATPPSGAGGLPQPEWFNSMAAGMKFTIYDENGTAQYSQTVNVGSIPPEDWGKLRQTYTAPISGLLEVEIFNYNINFPVYFDDWHIQLTENSKPEIVQEVHYDPWGLVMQDESFFAPPSGAGGLTDGLFLFNGKELQTLADLHLYDYHWRQYDPQLGRWHSPDPADQFHGLSGYAYCANNPVMLSDPDGRWVHIVVGAVVGGLVNLGVKAFQGRIGSVWDGLAAFGIGAAAGALGAATGGASLAATGLSATSLGGMALAGGVGAAFASPVQGLGNAAYFGDPYSIEQWGMDIGMGVAAGVVSYGAGKAFKALFPKTTQTISRAVIRIEQKIKNWFDGVKPIPRATVNGASGGTFETGDLIFGSTVDDVTGMSSNQAWGYKGGDVYYSGMTYGNPNSLTITEVGRTWNETTRNVASIMKSVQTNGFTTPIEIYQHSGINYVVNGHHRVWAAQRLGIDVPYRTLSSSELLKYYGGGIAELQQAAYRASFQSVKIDNRLLLRLLK
jgi:RHS repeat-associated protein